MTAASPLLIVAIDGGAASGKSTAARTLAERFNLLHVDTGSFYRALTAELLRRGVAAVDTAAVRAAVAKLAFGTLVEERAARMTIDGHSVPEEEIRGGRVNDHVSHFAALPEVRAALLAYQRGQVDVAESHGFQGLVMEGRDIGSVIFPNADFRYFLQADAEERTRRRAHEGRRDAVTERDRLDSSRATAPLACPDGATAIDATHLTRAEVVAVMAGPIDARVSGI